jgi:hypothetical protein
MSEPRAAISDFERWIAGSRIPPDERDPKALCEGIAAAIGSRDFQAVVALLTVLAFADPRKARRVHDMILAACEGDVDRATLLAVLG